MLDRCFKKSKKTRILRQFQIKMEKELDLEKVLHRLRLFTFASLGTLSMDQSILADKMSRIVIKESSD